MSKAEFRAYQFAAQEPSKGSTVEDLKDVIERNKALDKKFNNPKYAEMW